jgi:hypothetical protein
MNVQQLIEQLKRYPADTEVKVTVTDPTDWKYMVDIESVEMDEPQYDDMEDELLDDEGNYIGPKVVIIDIGTV